MPRKPKLPFSRRRKQEGAPRVPEPDPAAAGPETDDPAPVEPAGGFVWRPPDSVGRPEQEADPAETATTSVPALPDRSTDSTASGADPTEAATSPVAAVPGSSGPAGTGDDDPAVPVSRRRRLALIAGAAACFLVLGAALGWLVAGLLEEEGIGPAPAPTVVIEQAPEPEAAEEIGFPAFATRNTTRVGGSDPVADAAGVALASHPSFGGVGGPGAAVLAPAGSWQATLAAASLSGEQIGAPILLGEPQEVPDFTAEALRALSPSGLRRADGAALIAVGDVAVPEGVDVLEIPGSEPAELAKAIDRQRARLSGVADPDNIVVVSSAEPAFAMPAASWAAFAGEPIVFADGEELPDATRDVLGRHPDANVYVLGPPEAVGRQVVNEIREEGHRVLRISGETPEANSVAFARFVDGDFGWNINDPGHGFVIANSSRPADAGAAAPLSAAAKPGPLLVTTEAEQVPAELRSFLLDTKPGFTEDATRAVYNHVWLMGDTSAISVGFQAQVDELVNLERVSEGAGLPDFALPPDDGEAEEPEAEEPDDRPRGAGAPPRPS